MFEAMNERLARADQLCSQRDRQANMVLHQTPVPPKVLVVEDEMMLRMRAVDIVEDAGFTPIEAVNADEALAILESSHFFGRYCSHNCSASARSREYNSRRNFRGFGPPILADAFLGIGRSL